MLKNKQTKNNGKHNFVQYVQSPPIKYRWLSMYVTSMYYWVYVSVYACDCNHGVYMWVLWGKGGVCLSL